MRLDAITAWLGAGNGRRALVLSFLVAGCATTQQAPEIPPSPEQVPALQRAFARDSTNIGLRVRLAEAQRRAGQANMAARLLEPVAATTPSAAFYLALAREDQGRPADARQLYEGFLARAGNSPLRDRVRDRLTILGRLELQEAIRASLARERELPAQPEPRTVGVFPFLTTTGDPQLHPLGTAFAELMANDLAQTDRLRIVERVRVQQLLDEIRLAEARRVDPATAARSGRLLGAGTIVQGRIEGTGTELTIQAAVVRVQANPTAANPLRERDALNRLFDVEKKLALGVYDRMGIQLSAAERDRITRHATRNVQALLEFGIGLEAQDAGRYADAVPHFTRATQLDPNFTLAARRLEEATIQARAAALSLQSLSDLALGDFAARSPAVSVSRRVDLFAPVERLLPDPAIRDASAEALGAEGFGRHGTAEIVIRRPPQ